MQQTENKHNLHCYLQVSLHKTVQWTNDHYSKRDFHYKKINDWDCKHNKLFFIHHRCVTDEKSTADTEALSAYPTGNAG